MRTESSATPQTIYLKDYTPAPFLAQSISLNFALFTEKTVVSSTVDYLKNPVGLSQDLVLNGDHQTVTQVLLNGQAFSDYVIAGV